MLDRFNLTPCALLPRKDWEHIDAALLKRAAPQPINLDTLASAIFDGSTAQAVQDYLKSYTEPRCKICLTELVQDKHPILCYAIAQNDASMVRHLLDYGADPDARDESGMSVLECAILRSKYTVIDPLEVVKVLLANGAKPDVIPRDMWKDYPKIPSITADEDVDEFLGKGNSVDDWFVHNRHQLLSQNLHPSIQYFLYKASQLKPATARSMQLARAHGYRSLLDVPYLIIGQYYACKLVVEQVSSHLDMNIHSPLVLTFPGPSGHGKTELATKMGELLGVSISVINCAQMRSDMDLFGSRLGYEGSGVGSQLNNHLVANDGKRCVVFLDEFDKTEQEVRHSLLLLLDSGQYHDRRTNRAIDSSKTIWILATNLGDRQISSFYTDNLEGVPDDKRLSVPYKSLIDSLKQIFTLSFGAPMAGRMSRAICPFLPFHHREQAIVVHKFFLELVRRVRQDIDTTSAVPFFHGHIHLEAANVGPLCLHLAAEWYNADRGARSLQDAVNDIRVTFDNAFKESEELVGEHMNTGPLTKYSILLKDTAGAGTDVTVQRDGVTHYFDAVRARRRPSPADRAQLDEEEEYDCDI